MNETTRQRATAGDMRAQGPSDDGHTSTLTAARANTDRLYDVAKKSFASMSEKNSEEFMKRSTQTGGQ